MPVFAFTDIEGSTGLWEKHQAAMGPIIARHYDILDSCVLAFGGKIIKKTGDGVFALFPEETKDRPSPALSCALEMQRRFQGEDWPVIHELRVRMAFHCGQAEEMAGDYYGPTANRTARFMSLGWGGQILASADLRRQATLPEGAQWTDLGVHQVKDLPEPQHLFGLTHPSLTLKEFPPLKSLSNRPHNLPEQPSPFFGRRKELAELAALLTGPGGRLVTLLGGGGMGKSRLAIQAALDNLAAFKHGVNRVRLYGVDSPAQLPARIADSLKIGLYRQKDPKEQLLEYLAGRNLLLILDPCELVSDGVGLISELLAACPDLRILACSRRRLNLRGEAVLEVRGLDLPGDGPLESSGCAQLFIQQVQGIKPGYSLKPEDRPAFTRICRVLQGMPLGLELAAVWLRSLPLATVAERLEQSPRFLATARQDLSESHRSLKALFGSAWVLLTAQERSALSALSVFRGSFSLEAAQEAALASPEVLSGLVDQCLLDVPGPGLYALPEWQRAFAAAGLDEEPARKEGVLDRHARHFCRFLKEREANLMGLDQARAIVELRRSFADIQGAWDRVVERAWVHEMGQAVRCLGLYTDMQGLGGDWEPRMARALELWEREASGALGSVPAGEAMAVQAGILANQANYLFSLGRGVEARAKAERALSLFKMAGDRSGAAYILVRISVFLGPEDERRAPALEEAANYYRELRDANGEAWARRNLGYLLCLQGDVPRGKPMVEESLAVFREVGNTRETAWCLNSLGQVALEAGQVEAGIKALREAREIFLGLGDLETAAWTLNRLGRAAIRRRQWAEARGYLEEGLKLFGRIRNFRGRSQALRSLCEIFAGQGDLKTAYLVLDRAVSEAQAEGDRSGQAWAQVQKGQLLSGEKRYDEALALMEEAEALFSKAGSDLGRGLALEAEGCVRLGQGRPGPARGLFDEACQIFAQAGMRDHEARLCVRLGDLDAAEAKPRHGEAWYQRALKLSRQNKPGDYTLGALLGIAVIVHRQGRRLEALHLALLCETALAGGMMQASEADFFAELGQKWQAVMAQIASKLMQTVIDEARAKLAEANPRAALKECVEKYWT